MPVMLIANTFTEQAGKTKLVSRTQFASAADKQSVVAMGAIQGLTETWDRLDAYLAQS